MERQQHSDGPQQLDLLRVCRIGRAQGLKGEVTVRLYTDEPEYRFAPGAVLYTQGGAKEYIVERSRTFKGRWIVKLEGVDDRNASEAMNGVELYGEADDPEELLDQDAWYLRDLIGLEARMADGNELGAPDGMVVGKVVDVIDGPQSLLKIRLSPALRGGGAEAAEAAETTEPAEAAGTANADEATEAADATNAADEAASGDAPAETTALVPFVDQLVPDIDLDGGYLTLDPPGGLIPGLS